MALSVDESVFMSNHDTLSHMESLLGSTSTSPLRPNELFCNRISAPALCFSALWHFACVEGSLRENAERVWGNEPFNRMTTSAGKSSEGFTSEDYKDALALVQCMLRACPRSVADAQHLENAAQSILNHGRVVAAEVQRPATSARCGYVTGMAEVWRKLKTQGTDEADIFHYMTDRLQEAGIDWIHQDQERSKLVETFKKDRQGVRFEEMILGCGIGDAFGAGVEFFDGAWIHENVKGDQYVVHRGDPVLAYTYKGGMPLNHDGGGQNFVPGMYTDDCEMTCGLMHALIKAGDGGPDKDDMVAAWVAEYRKAPARYLLSWMWRLVNVGRNGHGGFQYVMHGNPTDDEIASRVAAMRQRVSETQFPGNAPPMRALPLSMICDDGLMLTLAAANANSTHPHPKARTASLGVALAGRFYMLQRRDAAGIIAAVVDDLRRLSHAAVGKSAEGEDVSLDAESIEYLTRVDQLPPPGPLNASYTDFISDETLEALCGAQPVWSQPSRPRTVRGLHADAQRTLGCVLWLLKHHEPGRPMLTLRRSLCVGGDVDSLAAIALGMVGGREGLRFGEAEGIPLFMLEQLEAAEYLCSMAAEFEEWVCRHAPGWSVGVHA